MESIWIHVESFWNPYFSPGFPLIVDFLLWFRNWKIPRRGIITFPKPWICFRCLGDVGRQLGKFSSLIHQLVDHLPLFPGFRQDLICFRIPVDDQMDIPQIICFKKTNDTIRIANCSYLRCRHYKSFIRTCNGILKSLLNSSRTIQQYIIKLFSQIIRQFDHLFR